MLTNLRLSFAILPMLALGQSNLASSHIPTVFENHNTTFTLPSSEYGRNETEISTTNTSTATLSRGLSTILTTILSNVTTASKSDLTTITTRAIGSTTMTSIKLVSTVQPSSTSPHHTPYTRTPTTQMSSGGPTLHDPTIPSSSTNTSNKRSSPRSETKTVQSQTSTAKPRSDHSPPPTMTSLAAGTAKSPISKSNSSTASAFTSSTATSSPSVSTSSASASNSSASASAPASTHSPTANNSSSASNSSYSSTSAPPSTSTSASEFHRKEDALTYAICLLAVVITMVAVAWMCSRYKCGIHINRRIIPKINSYLSTKRKPSAPLTRVITARRNMNRVPLKRQPTEKINLSYVSPYERWSSLPRNSRTAPGYVPSDPTPPKSTGIIASPLQRRFELDRDWVALDTDHSLGHGQFGEVFKAVLTYPKIGSARQKKLEAAVKVIQTTSEEVNLDFRKEINVMRQLGKHTNVVYAYGAVTASQTLWLAMEYCADGNLLDLLRGSRAADSLVSGQLAAFAYQAACGLEFLAASALVHRDIAARNVLVSGNTIKLGDFGLSCFVDSAAPSYHFVRGTVPVKWMAVEALRDNVATFATDVWSLGILLYEIMTFGTTPYPCIAMKDMLKFLQSGGRMAQPPECDDEMFAVMKCCWLQEPHSRPTAAQLRLRLWELLVDLDGEPYVDVAELSGAPFKARRKTTT